MRCTPIGSRSAFGIAVALAIVFCGHAWLSPSLRAETIAVKADIASRGRLAEQLTPFYEVWSGKAERFTLSVDATVQLDNKPQSITATIARHDNESFDFIVAHPDYAVEVYRRAEITAMVLPKHNRSFIGTGSLALDGFHADDHLAPQGISSRLCSQASQITGFVNMLSMGDAGSMISLVSSLIEIEQLDDNRSWRLGGTVGVTFETVDAKQRMMLSMGDNVATVTLAAKTKPADAIAWTKYEQVSLPRAEIEEQFSRGIRRAWEILWPSATLTNPSLVAKRVEHGELRFVDGQRLVLLSGTPQQVGIAHGELLKEESQKCIDSVLNTFGSVQTINSGRWFRHDLANAYARLKPHIPADHIIETRALAATIGQSPEMMEQLNVFPELFHCSGFAVFNTATVDGKLYHGRVLDYMTTIGLQDAATTFVVSIDNKIPFANIGYAGFTGSVSGMNANAISLGEMGGRGEGQWDGVPMATLMRRALEECSTLDQVKELWSTSPRTCEYYYVFADGKTNEAVGVAATPEQVEFVAPGQSDPRLGEGITDAVVMSAGSRLEELRKRVTDHHGKIDVDKAMWLMSRPVAMSSNLHNVLFVPADGVFYVANASHDQPAADRPYVKYDLRQLLP